MTLNETNDKPPFVLNDAIYGKVKWLIVVVIPAVGTLYFALAKIWDLSSGEQILGTLLAVQAFLGVIFAISTSQYNNSDTKYDGAIVQTKTSTGTQASLEFNEHPADILEKKDQVLLKVK
jgi:hypothetical protein